MTRILHAVPSVAARDGGPSAAVLGMCRALAAAGAPVLVATTDADGPGRLDVPIGEVTTYGGVPAIFFRRRATESFKWSPSLASWLRRQVAGFDLVHVHAVFSHTSIAAGRACRRRGVPYVVRPLGTLDPWSLRRHALRKRLMLRVAAGRLLSGAVAVHYTSDEEQRLAETSLPFLPRGHVVPLGVDEDLYAAPRTPETPPFVLALSRLDEKKGLDLLIEAFHRVAGSGSSWRLVIAGTGDEAWVARLKQIAAAGAASPRIVFAGWAGGAEKVALFSRASLFALPSAQENFGIAAAEAMAAGVPVVVSPGVNLADAVAAAEAGWVSDRAPAALAAGLGAAMADSRERERRGRNARRVAERFRWAAVADQLQCMYEEVVTARCAA